MKRKGHIVVLMAVLALLLAFYLKPASIEDTDSQQAALEGRMKVAKDTLGFLWLTDNGTALTRNLCEYTYPATAIDTSLIVDKRDSVMGHHIKGETPQMHMATEHRLPVSHHLLPNGDIRTVGYWQMEGDMMGGPFVSVSHLEVAQQLVTVREAFVYGPDRNKEAALKQLEEKLTTSMKEKK